MNSTVAILGRGKTRKHLTHYSKSVDYWALNDDALTMPEGVISAVWEMHTDCMKRYDHIPEYYEFLKEPHAFPIITHGTVKEIPASLPFPLWMMPRRYFTCTVAYALAYAIYCTSYQRIELWGIDLMNEPGQNYGEQRASVYYWMGRAEGEWKQIALPPESKLFDAPLYFSPG